MVGPSLSHTQSLLEITGSECCTLSSVGDVMTGHHTTSMSCSDIVTLRRVTGFQNLSVKLDLRSFGGFSNIVLYLSLPSS